MKRTGLGETGAPTSDGARLANTSEMREAVIKDGTFAFALYWNSAQGGYDSRMDTRHGGRLVRGLISRRCGRAA